MSPEHNLTTICVLGALLDTVTGEARGIHRLFPSLANLRTKSRSPNGSESDRIPVSPALQTPAARGPEGFAGNLHVLIPGVDVSEEENDEDEVGLRKAIELNLEGVGKEARSGGANRTNLVQLQRALALSLLEGGFTPEYEGEDDEEDEEEEEETGEDSTT
jgi:hypothetical protein